MSCYDVLEWVGEEVLTEYETLAHNRGLQVHLGFYGILKSHNQLQSQILLFLSNYTIKSIFSGVSPPLPPNWKFSSP